MRYILAYDVGTTAIKAILIDRETDNMQSASVNCALNQPQPGWAEQDADALWENVCEASRMCVAEGKIDLTQIGGIVFCAPWRHIIPLDENYRPIRKSIIWMDSRAITQSAVLNERMGHYVDNAQGYWARLMWLKENEPDIWERAKYIAGINDYFKLQATGNFCTECSDDFIHSPNEKLQDYYNRVLEAAGLTEDLDKFPPCIACTDCAGRLTEEAAASMGLVPGIPVFGGFGDLPAVYLGSGCTEPGTAHIYLGTSGWFGELLPDQLENYSSSWFTANGECQGALFGLTTGARAYEWIINRFYKAEKEELGGGIYGLVDQEMAAVNPGCDGLIVTHWLNGEPAPLAKNAKSLFFNVTEQHERGHFARAMLESICYTNRRSLEKYIECHGHAPKKVTVVGGGACSDVWMQAMADVLKQPITVPKNPRYVGTMGSYYCALIGLGIKEDFSDLSHHEGGKVFMPNPDNAEVYDKMYGIYVDLYPSLKNLYDRANGVY